MAGIIVGVLIGLVVALVFAVLTLGRLMQELPSIREHWRETYEQKGDAIARWNRWGCLGQLLYSISLALLLINGHVIAFIILLFLIIPLAFTLEGLKILNFDYAEVRPVFRPLHFITGRRAVRRGKALVAIGLLLLIPWLGLVVYILQWLQLL